MGFLDIFQEMNDMVIKLNSTKQVVSAKEIVNPHLSAPMKNASGWVAGNLSPGTPNESTLELANLNPGTMKNDSGLAAGNLSPGTPNESTPELAILNHVSSTIVADIGELEVSKETDNWQTVVQAMDQEVDHHMCVTVEEKEDDPVITKKTNITNIPSKTRQSARIQDANDHILKKAIAQKANAKGITSPSIPPPPNPSCSLDLLARVCGFSLGYDESTRIANISLIQAKEEALLALQNTKQKLSSIPKSSGENAHGDRPVDESSLTL
jgi:hypothetical protein